MLLAARLGLAVLVLLIAAPARAQSGGDGEPARTGDDLQERLERETVEPGPTEEEEEEKEEKKEPRAQPRALRVAVQEEERGGMRSALDLAVTGGIDEDLSSVARVLAGALLGWGRFALEAHVAGEGFVPLDGGRGINGRSVGFDLGSRFAFSDARFRGPFIGLGASLGLYLGRPRERELSGEIETCRGFDEGSPGSCRFDIEKNVAARLGFGYGFGAGASTTLALRVDVAYWLLAVDGAQQAGSVPAVRVEKPQQSVSVLVGLELMRWL
jgi:hypothetical protein